MGVVAFDNNCNSIEEVVEVGMDKEGMGIRLVEELERMIAADEGTHSSFDLSSIIMFSFVILAHISITIVFTVIFSFFLIFSHNWQLFTFLDVISPSVNFSSFC